MADKEVSELIEAERITPTDLFVLEQNGTAKKLTGQVLLSWLTAAADGHGGIQHIQKVGTSNLMDTYRITLADTTTFDFVVTNGRGVVNIAKTSTSGLVDTYTITYNDATTSSFNVTNGAKGNKGDAASVWIKYASQQPTEDSHSFGDIPDEWIGIASNNLSTAPTDWHSYKWYKIKGEPGPIGSTPSLSIGTVTTVPYGEEASASIGGSKENPVLNLRIPAGRPGANGDGSADLAENNPANPGYVDNRTHFVKSDSVDIFAVAVEISAGNTIFSFSYVNSVDYGAVYEVEFNDQVYYCRSYDLVAVLGTHVPAIGNLYLLSREFENTGEPFAFYIIDSTCTMQAPGYEGQTVYLKVKRDEEIQKLDNKFLNAEWVATKETVGVDGPILDYAIQFNSASAIINKISNKGLEEGGKYTVTWNGTAYECTCIADADEALYLGNPELASFVTDEGNHAAPFCFVSYGTAAFVYKNTDTAETITTKIVGHRQTRVKKLPGKFLPDGVPYVEGGGMEEILPETQVVAVEGDLMLPAAPSLIVGETYTVKWNGTEYQSVAIDGAELGEPGCIVLGDVYTLSDGQFGSEATGEPFVLLVIPELGATMVIPFEWTEGDPLPTVSIYGAGATIHKIDPRCLPDDVGGVKLFNVPFTVEASVASTTMTFAEIYEKVTTANTIVRGIVTTAGAGCIVYTLQSYSESLVSFSCVQATGSSNGLQIFTIAVNSDDTCTFATAIK